jgi:aspartate/methionine/tyrosine aminotransferase
MKIKEFGVEIWMNNYETKCRYNLAETCVESLTVQQLLEIAGAKGEALAELLPLKLTYGAIEGSDRLRGQIASLYEKQKPDNVLIAHGAIGANALVYETLIEPGDEIVSIVPNYQQHYSIAESYRATVRLLKLREEDRFLPDLDALRKLVTAKTRLIALSNPNNPTGSLIDAAGLREIAAIAGKSGAYVLCDEVYRGLDEQGSGFTASIADLYERGISTGSMSKTYGLAGLRLGWIVAPKDVIHAVTIHRDYNTISVGMLDDHFAALALENREALLKRNQGIARGNRKLFDAWVAAESKISYVKPSSGTTALLKPETRMSSREFCIRLLEETGVLFTPGSALDMEGYLRIGYANNPEILRTGLEMFSGFLAKLN